MQLSYEEIKKVYEKKSYPFYTKPYDLNLFGIRNQDLNQSEDKFNDWLGIVYTDEDGEGKVLLVQGTTDPALKELVNPSFSEAQKDGTAIMVPNYYKNLYKFGTHGSGNYKHIALQQVGPVQIYRDNNRDTRLTTSNVKVTKGFYGINFHAASLWQDLDKINGYSAGCQVVRDYDKDFSQFVKLWIKQIENNLGDIFSYALFNQEDFK